MNKKILILSSLCLMANLQIDNADAGIKQVFSKKKTKTEKPISRFTKGENVDTQTSEAYNKLKEKREYNLSESNRIQTQALRTKFQNLVDELSVQIDSLKKNGGGSRAKIANIPSALSMKTLNTLVIIGNTLQEINLLNRKVFFKTSRETDVGMAILDSISDKKNRKIKKVAEKTQNVTKYLEGARKSLQSLSKDFEAILSQIHKSSDIFDIKKAVSLDKPLQKKIDAFSKRYDNVVKAFMKYVDDETLSLEISHSLYSKVGLDGKVISGKEALAPSHKAKDDEIEKKRKHRSVRNKDANVKDPSVNPFNASPGKNLPDNDEVLHLEDHADDEVEEAYPKGNIPPPPPMPSRDVKKDNNIPPPPSLKLPKAEDNVRPKPAGRDALDADLNKGSPEEAMKRLKKVKPKTPEEIAKEEAARKEELRKKGDLPTLISNKMKARRQDIAPEEDEDESDDWEED